jgi:hypothetical protein
MIVQHTIAQESFINNANFLDSIKNTSVKLNETDSNFIIKNSTNVDVVKYKIAENQMEAEVKYKAEDSIIYQIEEKTMYLYGNSFIEYQDMKMWAEKILYNWDNGEVFAKGDIDDSSGVFEKVYFTQAEGNYEADSARFNFKTKKGKSYGLVTKQLEGFLHTEIVKVMNDSMFYAKNARYTTCDLDHPHFYVEINKAKVVKDKFIVGKPANLVISDVRTPLFLPFAFIPNIKKERQGSGLIFPTYGDQQELGFFLKGLGYYYKINEKIDISVTADIYTLGSWAINASSTYKKLYKVYGNINFNIGQIRQGWANEKRNPNHTKAPLDFGINWSLNLDPKRLYNANFGLSVNVRSSKRYQQLSNQNPLEVVSNTFTSSLNYSKNFPGKPYSFNISSNYVQNTESKAVTLTLPNINFSVSRINPFEKKIKSTTRKWYEDIGFSYSMNAVNNINTYDSIFFKKETLRRMRNGIQHNLPISANFRLFKFINFNTTFNYTERWHFYYTNRNFRDTLTYFDKNDSTYKIRRNVSEIDTTYKFNTNRNFSLNLGLSTNLYGTLQFKNSKLKAIRHTFRPSMGFSFQPDFSKPLWKSWYTVQTDTSGRTTDYSRFEQTQFGGPSKGKIASINFNFSNTLEIKIKSKKDTITGTKKITILDALNFGLGYNFAAEKFKLNFSGISGSTHITDKLNLSFNVGLDPYATDSNRTRINTFYWKTNKRFLRFTGMNVSLNGSYTSKKYNNKNTQQIEQQQGLDLSPTFKNVYQLGYYNFDIPWSINYNYNLNWQKAYINKKDTNIITQTLNLGVDFNITSKWKINVNTGFDATNKKITRTDISVVRDLHCWQLEMRWSPIATQQSFFITIYVKSQQFNFLRLQKQKSFFNSGFFGSSGFNGIGGTGSSLSTTGF